MFEIRRVNELKEWQQPPLEVAETFSEALDLRNEYEGLDLYILDTETGYMY